jgi:superfamily I DNA/RNA helicase
LKVGDDWKDIESGVEEFTTDGEYDSEKAKKYFKKGQRYRPVFQDDEESEWKLDQLKKTKDFGSSGAGTRVRQFESIQAIFLAIKQAHPEVKLEPENAVYFFKSYIRNIISLINLKNKNINTLQSILWKRILKLHNLENSISDNYLESLKSYFDLPNVKDLYNIIIDDECNLDNIINYICSTNNQVNLDDINLFLSKINKTSYETILQSINSLYLNDSYNCNTDSIELSTIHGSKGLEWKFVYLIDMNSKDYPKSKNENECEEERRLFYVASSRAKNHLYISYHKNETEKIYQSPYIKEINKDFFEYIIN